MFTSLDHIIIGVHNLEEAARVFGDRLGLVPSGGGIHPSGGTANRIVVIGDTYLELLAIDRPGEAQESLRRRLEQGQGYLNFVLASDDIDADSQAIRQRGVELNGPVAGSLRSADGRERRWMRTDIERPEMVQRYPFIIQHDSVGEERRRRLAGWSTPPEHPLGVSKVLSITRAVADLAEASSRFAHVYGLQPSEPFAAAAQDWRAQLVAFKLGQSGQSVELAAPAHDSEASEASDALRKHLEQYGESVFCMTLLVEDLTRARHYLDARAVSYTASEAAQTQLWLDPVRSCGARIVLRQG